jgi:hypothetical protein
MAIVIRKSPIAIVDTSGDESRYPAADHIFVGRASGRDNSDYDALVAAAVPQRYWKIIAGDRLAEMDAAEKLALDSSAPELAVARAAQMVAIDAKSEELFTAGFEYPPASGIKFGLALDTRVILLGLFTARGDPAFTYPVEFNRLDSSGTILLNDQNDVRNFFLSAMARVRTVLEGGTAVKNLVRAATTVQAIEAIVDTRT